MTTENEKHAKLAEQFAALQAAAKEAGTPLIFRFYDGESAVVLSHVRGDQTNPAAVMVYPSMRAASEPAGQVVLAFDAKTLLSLLPLLLQQTHLALGFVPEEHDEEHEKCGAISTGARGVRDGQECQKHEGHDGFHQGKRGEMWS